MRMPYRLTYGKSHLRFEKPRKRLPFQPLWKRNMPEYPYHWSGDPQRRVFLPSFWLKLIHPDAIGRRLPPGLVSFVVHPQMSRFDVKNYLEKIYKVRIHSVAMAVKSGEERRNPINGDPMEPSQDERIAFVQLAKGEHFEFPNLWKDFLTFEDKITEQSLIDKPADDQPEANFPERFAGRKVPSWFTIGSKASTAADKLSK